MVECGGPYSILLGKVVRGAYIGAEVLKGVHATYMSCFNFDDLV